MPETADDPRRFYVDGLVLSQGFTQIPNVVLRRRDLSGNAKAMWAIVYDVVVFHRDEPNMDDLGELIGAGAKVARAALKELHDAGLLVTRRRGLGHTNSYHLLDPEGWTEPMPNREIQNGQIGRSGTAESAEPSSLERQPSQDKTPPTPPSPEEPNRETTDENDENPLAALKDPPRLVKIDGHDIGLDALLDACGIDPKSPRLAQAVVAMNGRGKTTGIRSLYWVECRRYAEAHADDPLEAAQGLVTLTGERFERGLAARIERKAHLIRQQQPWRRTLVPADLQQFWLDVEVASESGALSPEAIERLGRAQ